MFFYNKIQNRAQQAKIWNQHSFNSFVTRSFWSKFLVKSVSIPLLSFTLRHFHKSSPTLLKKLNLLVLPPIRSMPKHLSEMNIGLDSALNLPTFHYFDGFGFDNFCLTSVSSEISDLYEISDLLLFVSYFASQSKRINFAISFFMCVVQIKTL